MSHGSTVAAFSIVAFACAAIGYIVGRTEGDNTISAILAACNDDSLSVKSSPNEDKKT